MASSASLDRKVREAMHLLAEAGRMDLVVPVMKARWSASDIGPVSITLRTMWLYVAARIKGMQKRTRAALLLPLMPLGSFR
ncbi:hypothetical protein NDU88_006904 [Pleurodeles waltl]|uniref:Uncharacterized protein n=1 Tax=Pleurodeles waltl TaxID=8319 RepID=A0AAV7N279_PLEWA|nr:hypothetical protein NDU88_006904 [Pleurodeles waltl]